MLLSLESSCKLVYHPRKSTHRIDLANLLQNIIALKPAGPKSSAFWIDPPSPKITQFLQLEFRLKLLGNFRRWRVYPKSTRLGTRPRNPRFKDVHTGTKRRLDVKTSNRDSGISGSAWDRLTKNRCYLQNIIASTLASHTIFCYHLANLLQT